MSTEKKRGEIKTSVQQEFYEKLAGKRKYVKKEKPSYKIEPISKEQYLKNCMWWLQEYFTGRTDKEHFDKTIQHIITYANEPQPLLKENILNYR